MLSAISRDQIAGLACMFSEKVDLSLFDRDGMYNGNGHHYLTCGASAMNVISAALERSEIVPGRILDFGSGAGRVTRWLRAAHPDAELYCTDIRLADLEFCAGAFGAKTFESSIVVDELISPETYDLIWVGSVLTHLPEAASRHLTRKLTSWLRPGGVLVMSVHGRFALGRAPKFGYYGIETGWNDLLQDLETKGFGYADYPHQSGYGISISSLAWATKLVEGIGGARLVLLSERAWDGHHDVVALQMRPVLQGL